jgi:two-component system response regulator EvgA
MRIRRVIVPTLRRATREVNGAYSGRISGLAPVCDATKLGACPVEDGARLCDDEQVTLSVLIVDDHAGFRASARTLLEHDGFAVCGEAADGASGIALARALRPDLVLLDVALPDVGGFEVAETLSAEGLRVVLVSSRARRDLGRRPGRSGALGFVPKDELTAAALHALLEAA